VRSIWVRLLYSICLIGWSVWLLGCGETRLPAPDMTAPQVWAQPAGGIFGQLPPSIVLASTKEATIYYTLDGSPPTTTSRVYAKPLTFNTAAVTLCFFAQDASGNTSPEQAERYRQVTDAPQLSIQTAPSSRPETSAAGDRTMAM
jgi:Chitobiase/beta-hexosaminidase C-terminal domain